MSGLVTADFQWEFDGLLLGNTTPYNVTAAPGFLDLSGVRANFTPRARAHGGYTEPHFGGGAILDLEYNIQATSAVTFAAAVLALEAGTYPQQGTRPLWWQIPGHPLLTMQVQCIRRTIPLTTDYQVGLVIASALQFYAPDPLKYGPPQNASTGLPTAGGGLTYPLNYPLDYGSAGNPGQAAAQNIGTADVSPVFTVSGPIDSLGFQITSLEDGITLQFNGALGASDQVTIDTRTGAVVLNGTNDRRGLLSYSLWPKIPAGTTRTFAFTALGAYQAAASLLVAWSPAFW